MIVTKEHQEALVEKYVKEKHNQDECIGFIDGLNTTLELVENLTIPRVSKRSELLFDFIQKYNQRQTSWDSIIDSDNVELYLKGKL